MIRRIVAICLLPMLIIALCLHFGGVNHIGFDNSYYNFMSNVALKLNNWKFTIPSIPTIPTYSGTTAKVILDVLISFVNGLVTFVNAIITFINVLISLIQFVLTLVYCVIDFVVRQTEVNAQPTA